MTRTEMPYRKCFPTYPLSKCTSNTRVKKIYLYFRINTHVNHHNTLQFITITKRSKKKNCTKNLHFIWVHYATFSAITGNVAPTMHIEFITSMTHNNKDEFKRTFSFQGRESVTRLSKKNSKIKNKNRKEARYKNKTNTKTKNENKMAFRWWS